jgi:hypothetical protein
MHLQSLLSAPMLATMRMLARAWSSARSASGQARALMEPGLNQLIEEVQAMGYMAALGQAMAGNR